MNPQEAASSRIVAWKREARARPPGPRSTRSTAATVVEHERAALNDRRVGGGLAGNAGEKGHQRARDAAVRDDEGVGGERGEPRPPPAPPASRSFRRAAEARTSICRPGAPSPPSGSRASTSGQVRPSQSPNVISFKAGRRDNASAAGPSRARASSIVSRARSSGEATKAWAASSLIDFVADGALERPADRARLIAAARVERDVALALQPVLGVVRRFAVAHENETMRESVTVAKVLSCRMRRGRLPRPSRRVKRRAAESPIFPRARDIRRPARPRPWSRPRASRPRRTHGRGAGPSRSATSSCRP